MYPFIFSLYLLSQCALRFNILTDHLCVGQTCSRPVLEAGDSKKTLLFFKKLMFIAKLPSTRLQNPQEHKLLPNTGLGAFDT
jgi:hypothetical protein